MNKSMTTQTKHMNKNKLPPDIEKRFGGLVEKLADIEHQRWSDWQKYLHGMCDKLPDGGLKILNGHVDRWNRQIKTGYENLTETEKESDREQVRRYLPLFKQFLADVLAEQREKMFEVAKKEILSYEISGRNYIQFLADVLAEEREKIFEDIEELEDGNFPSIVLRKLKQKYL